MELQASALQEELGNSPLPRSMPLGRRVRQAELQAMPHWLPPQVLLELMELQARQEELGNGPVLRSTLLDGRRIGLRLMAAQDLPASGRLSLRVAKVVPSAYDDAPLSDGDFKARWGGWGGYGGIRARPGDCLAAWGRGLRLRTARCGSPFARVCTSRVGRVWWLSRPAARPSAPGPSVPDE